MEDSQMVSSSGASAQLTHNVVVFGETGVGKSSLINMIADEPVAKMSADAAGCTLTSTPYNVTLNNNSIKLWDTAGLNEGDKGTVDMKTAIINLYLLLQGLAEGVSLLVLCMRAPSIRDSTVKNYQMFWEGLCEKKVPIVLVVTGLEQEETMEDWWVRNADEFRKQQMSFDGHACTTATKGKRQGDRYMFETEYAESRDKVRDLVEKHCSQEAQGKEKPSLQASDIAKLIFNIGTKNLQIPPLVLANFLCEVLVKQGGYPKKEARKLANDARVRLIMPEEKANKWLARLNR